MKKVILILLVIFMNIKPIDLDSPEGRAFLEKSKYSCERTGGKWDEFKRDCICPEVDPKYYVSSFDSYNGCKKIWIYNK